MSCISTHEKVVALFVLVVVVVSLEACTFIDIAIPDLSNRGVHFLTSLPNNAPTCEVFYEGVRRDHSDMVPCSPSSLRFLIEATREDFAPRYLHIMGTLRQTKSVPLPAFPRRSIHTTRRLIARVRLHRKQLS